MTGLQQSHVGLLTCGELDEESGSKKVSVSLPQKHNKQLIRVLFKTIETGKLINIGMCGTLNFTLVYLIE